MSTIIAEFSDYNIQSVEFFIKSIEDALALRDIAGLTNNRIQKINISKEHPLVVLMGSVLNPNTNMDTIRTSLLPAISVTPGNMGEEGVSFGETPESFVVSDTFINELKDLIHLDFKDIMYNTGLITKDQIDLITSAYRKDPESILCQKNSWSWNEEINISCWSDKADLDILFGTLIDSILAKIRVGLIGDESPMRNLKYRITKGLTNFNFGRVLFGTEYSLTFFNTYHNYTVFSETRGTGHDLISGFMIPNSEDVWTPTE